MFDILITGGQVIDGSGLPRFRADIGITGGKIAAIGRLNNAEAKHEINASGKIVSPGFIDAHVHGDLMLLADHFLRRFAAENDKNLHGFTEDAMAGLLTQPWPGNVRELQNIIERATILAQSEFIEPRHLPGLMVEANVTFWR